MYQKLFGLLSIFTALMCVSSVSAQDDINAPIAWEIVERCIAEPIIPPDDWTYSGMILMSGYAGLHGIQANWETPRVLAFFSPDANGNEPLEGGQLSPDGRWYALPLGEQRVDVSGMSSINYWIVRTLQVFDTSGTRDFLEFDVTHPDIMYERNPHPWQMYPVEWINSETVLINWAEVDLVDRRVQEASFGTGRPYFAFERISPDMTRVHRAEMLNTRFPSGFSTLFQRSDELVSIAEFDNIGSSAWRHDSTGFVAMVYGEARGLVYYDRDGNFVEQLMQFDEGGASFSLGLSGRHDRFWSPDDKYLIVPYSTLDSIPSHLYIVNFEQQIVIDTCLDEASIPVWSLDGAMLAYLSGNGDNFDVIVVDLETSQSYIVGRHSRERGEYSYPSMLGWRDAVDQ